MAGLQKKNQFSIAGMLFFLVGFSVFCGVIPYFDVASRMSPSWAVCVAIFLLFAWAMISWRQGTQRVWWCEILIFGSAYLATSLTIVLIIVDRFLVGFDEIYGVIGVLAATLAMLPVSAVLGGILFVACHRCIQHSRNASHSVSEVSPSLRTNSCVGLRRGPHIAAKAE